MKNERQVKNTRGGHLQTPNDRSDKTECVYIYIYMDNEYLNNKTCINLDDCLKHELYFNLCI